MSVKLTEYYDMLDKHDWFFDFSDDNERWRSGLTTEEKLREIATQSAAHSTLFAKFEKYKHADPFDSSVPKPKRPQ